MKIVCITGINRGLGKELFQQFLHKGYFVYGILRNAEEYEKLRLSLPENAKLILADIAGEDAVYKINDVIQSSVVHLLINNAGIGGSASILSEVSIDEMNRLFNVHCNGVVRVTAALKENLLQAENATVVNLNSRLGSIERQSIGQYNHLTVSYAYRIAKAAQNMLTNCLRAEFQGKIKFISWHPGLLKTSIAQIDAHVEPADAAKMLIEAWEQHALKEENGILELPGNVIDW